MDYNRIQHDLPCIECGYNLRTMRGRGCCPECGCSVWRSICRRHELPDAARIRQVREAVGLLIVAAFPAMLSWWLILSQIFSYPRWYRINSMMAWGLAGWGVAGWMLLLSLVLGWGVLRSRGLLEVTRHWWTTPLNLWVIAAAVARPFVWLLMLAICFELFDVPSMLAHWRFATLLMIVAGLELISWLSYGLTMQPLIKELLHERVSALHLFYVLALAALLMWVVYFRPGARYGMFWFILFNVALTPTTIYLQIVVMTAAPLILGVTILVGLWRRLGLLAAAAENEKQPAGQSNST